MNASTYFSLLSVLFVWIIRCKMELEIGKVSRQYGEVSESKQYGAGNMELCDFG